MTQRTQPTAQDVSPVPLERSALDELMPVVYGELRRMALSFLRRERQNHTLQPTALANEVYLRLAEQRHINAKNRTQFFGLAAQMMRRILINHAEAHNAAKRGPAIKLSLNQAEDEVVFSCKEQDVNLLALNDALTALTALDFEKGRIVELRFFGGLTMAEIAVLLGRSLATVEREWSLARAWLYREVHGKESSAIRKSSHGR
jgi:RNA polymerase sigma-70 factor, ECF subfamily